MARIQDLVPSTDASRFEPIEPEGAKPVEESDEQWLQRTVFELTGLACRITPWEKRGIYVEADGHGGTLLAFDHAEVRARSVGCVAARTQLGRGWPLKWRGLCGFRQGRPVRLRDPPACASAQPTPAETYCAECGAPEATYRKALDADGIRLCQVCMHRWCDRTAAEKVKRQPCGDGCRCVYCAHATYDGKHPREVTDANAGLSTHGLGRNVAARKRLAALEARELRLNDPSPAEVKMLDGARDALRHWPSVEDWEP